MAAETTPTKQSTRSSLHRIQSAKKKWEEHRQRLKLLQEQQDGGSAAKENNAPSSSSMVVPTAKLLDGDEAVTGVVVKTKPHDVSNEGGSDQTSAAAVALPPAFDRKKAILRSKKKGSTNTTTSTAAPAPAANPTPSFTFATSSTATATAGGAKNIFEISNTSFGISPFVSKTAAALSTRSGRYSASTPCGGGGTPSFTFAKPTEEKKDNGSDAAFPPMSTAAPKNPFTSIKPASASSSTTAAAAFPPMSTVAPKPFGSNSVASSSKKEDSKATGKPLGGSSSSAFPPMSAAAPKNPFSTSAAKPTSSSGGGGGTTFTFAKSTPTTIIEDESMNKVSSMGGNGGGAYPPMSTSAPKPFSTTSKDSTSESEGNAEGDDPPQVAAFDRKKAILRSKKKGNSASAPPTNPFANISLTNSSVSQSKSTFSFSIPSSSAATECKPNIFGSTSAFGGGTSTVATSLGGTGTTFAFASPAPTQTDKKEGEPPSEPSDGEENAEDDDIGDIIATVSGMKAMGVFNSILKDTDGSDTSLPASKFELVVEEIGEGFYGDELERQLALVDPTGSGILTRAAFAKWYCNLVDQNGDDDDESSQDSEIAEEKSKAEGAFDKVSEGSAKIAASDLSKLIEELGSVYCEEEHRRTIKKISSLESGEKVITKDVFVDWYVEWLFGDDDSDEESASDDDSDANDEDAGKKESGSKPEGWGSMFNASEEGSWKCGVCMVMNEPSTTACAACETPKPGEEGKSSPGSTAKLATAPGSIGAGGFSFGGGLPPSSDSAAKSSSGIGSSGFSFGGFGIASSENKNDTAKSTTSTTGGCSFAASKSKGEPTGIGAGGFSFGGFGSKPDEKKADAKAVKTEAIGSSAFPPMSKAAPKNPFSAKPSPGSAALPPMSATAFKPFGAASKAGESKADEKPASSSAAFPPMSKAAPKNLPPMSAAAPKPVFGSKDENDTAVADKSVTPTPARVTRKAVSAKQKESSKDSEAKKQNPFANISLASSTATKPSFSFATAGKRGDSTADASSSKNTVGSTSAFGSGTSTGFTFSTSASPSPFGVKEDPEKKDDAQTTDSSSSSGSGYPPMSASAPKPFGSSAKEEKEKPASIKPSGDSGGYPPMSAAAPKPFSSATTEAPKSNVSPFGRTTLGGGSQTKSPFSSSTSSGSGSSNKSIFGSTSAFGGGGCSVFGDKNTSSGTTTSFGSGSNPTPFGAPATNSNQSPFGAPSGGSIFSGFGKTATSTISCLDAATQINQDIDYKAKVTEFYSEHNPSKLSSVDSILTKYLGQEEKLMSKLYSQYGLGQDGKIIVDLFSEPGGAGPRVYMDLSMGGHAMGRIVIQLYADKTPITAENFRGLCTGYTSDEDGHRRPLQKTYVRNNFHRIVPGMCFQGGDITARNGTGGRSIYPSNNPKYGTDAWGKFKDETPFMKHSKRGLLSMANAGANQNSSQFFITTKELPYLNGKHVVFGEVLEPEDTDTEVHEQQGQGMKVLDRIMEKIQVDPKNHRPKEECRVVIEACGQLS